jgi:GGDEF domain-containing protein
VPEVDKEAYKEFRTHISQLTLHLPDPLPEENKLTQIHAVLHEFEEYRNSATVELRDRQINWRAILQFVLRELIERLSADMVSGEAARLVDKIAELSSAKEILHYQKELDAFLHPVDARGRVQEIASPLKVTDRSMANDNAAGLLGGGSAIEHLQRIIDRGGAGFVAFFRLGCMNIISERFGVEATEDCLMAIAAYLTHSMHADDTIYHWSDSSLLTIMQGRPNERIVRAELNRVVMQNRDISIKVEGREIVLRIPLEFDIYPIQLFRSADELHHISSGVASTR